MGSLVRSVHRAELLAMTRFGNADAAELDSDDDYEMTQADYEELRQLTKQQGGRPAALLLRELPQLFVVRLRHLVVVVAVQLGCICVAETGHGEQFGTMHAAHKAAQKISDSRERASHDPH